MTLEEKKELIEAGQKNNEILTCKKIDSMTKKILIDYIGFILICIYGITILCYILLLFSFMPYVNETYSIYIGNSEWFSFLNEYNPVIEFYFLRICIFIVMTGAFMFLKLYKAIKKRDEESIKKMLIKWDRIQIVYISVVLVLFFILPMFIVFSIDLYEIFGKLGQNDFVLFGRTLSFIINVNIIKDGIALVSCLLPAIILEIFIQLIKSFNKVEIKRSFYNIMNYLNLKL